MKPANISNQRIMAEVKKLQNQKLSYLQAGPLPDDLYTWHFTFQGPENTEFHEGIYHGQILLPFQYPFKPPDIVFMNKNGRFETNTKICLTITQYHPEQWNSAWTIRTMLEAVISLFAQNIPGVGSLYSSTDVRAFLAKNSHSYVCQKCGPIKALLPPRGPQEVNLKAKEQKNQNEEAEQKIERKQSESVKPVQLPLLSSLYSERIEYQGKQRKADRFTDSRVPFSQKSKQEQTAQRIYEAEEQKSSPQSFSRNEIIYVRERNSQVEKQLLFKKETSKIRSNLKTLDSVFSSLKWV